MSHSNNFINNILNNNLVEAKKNIHEALLSKMGTILEDRILEVAPSMIGETKLSPKQQEIAKLGGDPKKIDNTDLKILRKGRANENFETEEPIDNDLDQDNDENIDTSENEETNEIDFDRFVEEVQQIIESIEQETGEELTEEEIIEIGEDYIKILNSLQE